MFVEHQSTSECKDIRRQVAQQEHYCFIFYILKLPLQ